MTRHAACYLTCLLLPLFATAAPAEPAPATLLPGDPKAWELVWSEEFDGPDAKLDERWHSQNGPSGHILCSRWRENAVVANGKLRLINKKESRGGQAWTSGSIRTKQEFRYGYFECRYRYAAAAGTNNSFWIMTTAKQPAGKKSFEIDINEGHYPDKVNTNIHNHSDVKIVKGKRTHPSSSKAFRFPAKPGAPRADFARDFHTFGLEWNETELVFYVDGKEIRRAKNEFCHQPAPVWLSLAIISWAGKVTDAIDGTFMEVDHVRIYQKKESGGHDFSRLLQPVPATARFSVPGYNVWCGSMVRGDDGKCHLFYSRWPEKLGHLAWVTHSEVAHAVADDPLGPYRHVDVALPPRGKEFWDGLCTHNPTVLRFGDKYYLYYMGNTGDGKAMTSLNWTHRNQQRVGVAVADSPNGPWQRFDQPLIAPTPGFHDAQCLANPSVVARPEGGYLMVYKAVADQGKQPFGGPVVHVVATADQPTGPFKKHPTPVFTKPGDPFPAEDPFIWRGRDRYWAIVKDFKGHFTKAGPSLALFQSTDGLDWKLADHPLVAKVGIQWEGKAWQALPKLERPQLWLRDGKPAVLFCAAAERSDLNQTYNVAIPLTERDW